MSNNNRFLDACPAQAPLMELLRLARGLENGPQAREIFKAIGVCPALLELAGSDPAVEAERAAHEKKMGDFS